MARREPSTSVELLCRPVERPLEDIADPDTLRRYGIEFDPKPHSADKSPPDPFEKALIRIKGQQALYVKEPCGVVFLGRSLFRGNIKLPAQVPEGHYTAQVYLFQSGQLLSRNKSLLTVQKEGIERISIPSHYQQPWLYGLLAVLLAAACGFLGWTLFSRN